MNIEKIKRSDLTQYKALMDECFGGSNDISVYENGYNEKLNYEILVAKIDDEIVGSITYYKMDLFTYSFQPALEIFNVAVKEKYRGRKIAKKIFEQIFKYAKENGYKSIYLTCLDNAYDAHHLYESVGFTKTNSIKYNIKL